MDSDSPPVEDGPFSSANTGKSRIADQMAQQRKGTVKAAALNKNAAKKPAGNKTASTKTFKATPSAARAHLSRKLDRAIETVPALTLNDGNISRMRWIVGMQALVIFVLAGTFIWGQAQRGDDNIYAALDRNYSPRLISGNTTPTYTQQAILSWAAVTASSVMNFGFHNYGDRLNATRDRFTDRGWTSFTDALRKSAIMDQITSKEQVITAAPIGAPVIVDQRTDPQGKRQWIVQIPMMVTVLSGKQTQATRSILTLTIVTVPPTHNLAGLGIENWIES